jgi:hypothetical protein
MSPHLHYEITRAMQHEIEARATRARHAHDLGTFPGHSRGGLKVRLGRVVAAVGVVRRSLAAS